MNFESLLSKSLSNYLDRVKKYKLNIDEIKKWKFIFNLSDKKTFLVNFKKKKLLNKKKITQMETALCLKLLKIFYNVYLKKLHMNNCQIGCYRRGRDLQIFFLKTLTTQ